MSRSAVFEGKRGRARRTSRRTASRTARSNRTHPALVRAAAALTAGEAARRLIAAYLGGAVFAPRSKLASMFKHCVSRAELDAAIDALAADGRVEIGGKTVVARPGRRSPAS